MTSGDDAQRGRQWEMLAREDPYWTSLTSGKRRMAWKLNEFLATGQREVVWALDSAKAFDLYPPSRALALDFGCGPGRLTGALAQSFDRVVGVDISPSMLDSARKNYASERISFAQSTRDIESGSVDLIYSTFVLQHFPKTALVTTFEEFARLLADGGLLIFQYPEEPRWTLPGIAFKALPTSFMNAAQRYIAGFPEAMPMNWMKPQKMITVTAQAGFGVCKSVSGPRYSPNWKDTWYLCAKEAGGR
ncbi:MAG: class I SAM-dependent methyltransferase [Frankiaceae bacterium]|nr:class I SAM-dependent methyltransferase [Frankiaceae bacterium]